MNNFTHIRFTIGTGKTKGGDTIDKWRIDLALDEVRSHCAKAFGGWTETPGCGGWHDHARGHLVIESCVIFDCALTGGLLPASDIEIIVHTVKTLLDQECVLVQKFTGESHLA
jgi:hypothetical protein